MRSRSWLTGFALGTATTLAGVTLFHASESGAVVASKLGRDGFGRALDTVLDRYVDPVDDSQLLARGLKHVVAGLDPHSHYLTAAERRLARKRSRGGSAGLTVALRKGKSAEERWLEVLAVAPGSPAHKAKLSPGDHVLSIRDRDVSRLLSQIDAESLLHGSEGETIALSVQRKREPGPTAVALRLEREKATPVAGELIAHGRGHVGHLRIGAFRRGTGKQTKRKLAALGRAAGRAGLLGIVIDLRGNAGGEVDEALVVADLFVDRGILTRTRGRGGRILREERAHAAGTDASTPLIVLQDRHSASAAELLAAALQGNRRARVVGERSYGKGTVQDVIGMEDGSVLSLTIARYFSPSDQVIDGVGVAPDIPVALGASRGPASGSGGSKGDAGLRAALDELVSSENG